MPPSPTRPALRARYDRRREEIVSAAARILARRGYDQTSVPDLAEAIGVSTGSLYHYFASKEELLVAICDQLLEPLLETALARGRGDLRGLIRLWVEHVVEHRDHMLVFQQERHVIERGERWRAVRASRKRFERLVGEELAAAERAGALRHGDRRLALLALLGMVNHTAQWYRPRGPLTVREIADGYADLLLVPVRGAP
jgi:AcrR family transcriptional regulator